MEHNAAIRTYMAILAERDAAVRERNLALDERRRAFAERDMAMLQRDAAIAERNTAIEERDKVLHALEMGENTIYDDETPQNYTMSQLTEHGYDTKPNIEQEKDNEGASSTKDKSQKTVKQGSEGLGQRVKVGSSKVWGSDTLNMMM